VLHPFPGRLGGYLLPGQRMFRGHRAMVNNPVAGSADTSAQLIAEAFLHEITDGMPGWRRVIRCAAPAP
jgi:hypothetical protein